MPPTPYSSNHQAALLSELLSEQIKQQSEPKTKTKWTLEEDAMLREAVATFGLNNWYLVSTRMPNRNGKQCRERWMGQLCPTISKRLWSQEEDETIIKSQKTFGNKWSHIAKLLEGRSSISVKNRWHWLVRHQSKTANNLVIMNSVLKSIESSPEAKKVFKPISLDDDRVFGQNFALFCNQLTTPSSITA